MQFKSVLLIFSGLFIFQPAISASDPEAPPIPYCIANKADYLRRKAELPVVLQRIEDRPNGKMYRLSGLGRLVANAAVKLRIADNNKLIMDVAVASSDNLLYVEDNYITSICVKGSIVQILLENGTSYKASINDEKSFDLQGGTFKATTEAEFAQEVEAVKTKINGGNAPSAPAPKQLGPPPTNGKK